MSATTTVVTTACPSWCAGENHRAYTEGVGHSGTMSAGTGFADVLAEQLDDDPVFVFVSSTVECLGSGQNDGWWFPADPAILRGIAADLLAGADAVERAL